MRLYEGLRVVEFTTNIAGPTIGRWLAEYGADVIHVERPVYGDDSRGYPPMFDGVSAQYHTLNHGKKSLVLDLKDPEGLKIAKELCKTADIVLESNRPGAMDRLGLGYEALREINPRLIYGSISAWGHKGPYADRPGYDVIAQGASGMMCYNGDDNTGPVKVFCEIGDYGAATSGFGAINAALYYRERTGLGQYVDISLVKTLASMAVKLDDQRIYHRETKKTGSQGSNLLCPYGTFRCPDGKYIIIACSNNSLTFRFFRLIGRPELCEDPRFASNMKRLENTEILMPVLYEWLEKMGTAANAEKALLSAGLPCSRVYTYEDVDQDPHYNEAGWFADIPMPEGMALRTRRLVGSPFEFSADKPEYKPLEGFGCGNYEILGQLGYSKEQVDQLETRWAEAVKKS